MSELRAVVPEGEALRYTTRTRDGSPVGLTDRRLLIARDGATSVALADVDEVTVQSFDWYLGALSVALVAFGAVSAPDNLVAGLAFAVAGLASLGVTYRKRGRVRVHTHGRPKPLTFHIDDTRGFRDAFRTSVEAYERTHGVGDPDPS